MPLGVSLTYAPVPLLLHARRIPARRRLRALVDAAIPGVQALWHGVFHDLRQAVSASALAAALAASHLLDAYSLLADLWHHEVERPVRRFLPLLLTALVDDAAGVTSETLAPSGEASSWPWVAGLDETTQAINAYVGTQVLAISATTMATVLHVLRGTVAEGLTIPLRVSRLWESLGLTPRQQRSVEGLRARLAAAGTPARQIAREVRLATERALIQRARQIATTEAHTAAEMGKFQETQLQIRAGVLDGERVRRDWIVQEDEKLCPFCAAIPDLNPDGVRADEPFLTPGPPLLTPSAHPSCRCEVDTRLLAEGV